MKHYIGNTTEVIKSPCKNCEVGYGSYSKGKDKIGEYIEVNICQDSCEKYKNYLKRI